MNKQKNDVKEAYIELFKEAHRKTRNSVRELNKDRIKNCSTCSKELNIITNELSGSWFDKDIGAYRFFAFCSTACKEKLWIKYREVKENLYEI